MGSESYQSFWRNSYPTPESTVWRVIRRWECVCPLEHSPLGISILLAIWPRDGKVCSLIRRWGIHLRYIWKIFRLAIQFNGCRYTFEFFDDDRWCVLLVGQFCREYNLNIIFLRESENLNTTPAEDQDSSARWINNNDRYIRKVAKQPKIRKYSTKFSN